MSASHDLPERMRDLPVDERRGLPVPYMNVQEDGSHDFTAVNISRLDGFSLCGICGKPLDYWLAFVGGPLSTQNRAFIDPPMHEECAEASIRLCPHMAIQGHRRAPEHRVIEGAVAPEGFVTDKPETVHISIARSFKITADRGGTPYLKIAPPRRVRNFAYVDGRLTEVDG